MQSVEDYVGAGGARCPHCGEADITGASVIIEAGAAYQAVTCSRCEAEWVDQYKLVGYEMTNAAPLSNNQDTIEYSVCEDCMLCIAHGHSDNMSGADNAHLEARMKAEIGSREGHFVSGVAPTEEDPEGTGYDEFSGCACELCNSSLAGSRHGVSLVFTDGGSQ